MGRVHLVLRDNGANIKKATKDLGINNEFGFIHTQQLVVLNYLKDQTSLRKLHLLQEK